MLHVYLDTRVLPVTYDVIKFLVAANAAAQMAAEDKIFLHIIAHQFREITPRDKATPLHVKRSRTRNIYLGLAEIFHRIVAVEYTEELPTQINYPCFPPAYNVTSPPVVAYGNDVLEAVYDSGFPVQVIQASEAGLNKTHKLRGAGNYLTMTLRTSPWEGQRDGSLDIWYSAYMQIKEQYDVRIYVIPDFDDICGEQIYKRYDWASCEWISMSPDNRVAMYSDALLNLSMAGGTTTLMCLLERVPFVSFGNLNVKSSVSTPEFYQNAGWQVGSQPRWLSSRQVFDWLEASEVTAEYIVSHVASVLGDH